MSDKKIIDIALQGKLGNFYLDVAFHTPKSGINVLFGPSGCGKTSILRAIAGLHHFNGKVIIGGEIWQNEHCFMPVYKRKIGYIFQEASLFSHLNVRKNLCYAFDVKNKNSAAYFEEVVSLLNLTQLINRLPHNLSGGERQRVAIGRALLSSPDVLLMDEPLSALDMTTRDDILPFIERLRDHLKLPIFYVTHDSYEVERLADTLILIKQGKILGTGNLQDLQADITLPLAYQRNAAVNLDAHIIDWNKNTGLCTLNVAGVHFLTPLAQRPYNNKMRLRIGASDVSINLEKAHHSSILNNLEAVILSKTQLNNHEILLSLGLTSHDNRSKVLILCRISQYSWQHLNLNIGMTVFAQIKGIALLGKI